MTMRDGNGTLSVVLAGHTKLKTIYASEGVRYLPVNGTVIVRYGKLVDGVLPGKAIRAPLSR
jgi:hypothetical protein